MKKELKFPVFEQPLPAARRLSMDEYLAFVMQFRQSPPPRRNPESGEETPRRYVRFKLP